MWMKRQALKLACGANSSVAKRPNHVLTSGRVEIVLCAASCETVKRMKAPTVLQAMEQT